MSYIKQMQALADEFYEAIGHRSVSTREMARWAIETGKCSANPPITAICFSILSTFAIFLFPLRWTYRITEKNTRQELFRIT